ncbi:cytochrome c oxidase assembly protein [Sphaerisporangium rubeum]|uniref:Putative copper resistance protein D n=1 Tax=Sphaerisporangium rubeum TaxID=321317 RepID=A0A7X0IA65_9ACTN|nr:cytochrome c oxidase assembly protein [Sphaerisporangium rubeum]MBB6470709.1 putative copper resistance protein D [Sphaerisporangium rubeum]
MTTPSQRRPAVYALMAAGAVLVLFLAMWFGGAWPGTEIPGLPTPGALTTLGLPVVRVAHDVCAAVTIGLLLAAAAFGGGPAERRGAGRAAALWGIGWAVTAALTLLLTLSDLLGLPIGEALDSGFLPTFALEVPQGRAFLIVAVAALVIAAASWLLAGRAWCVVLPLAAVLAVLPPAYVGHSASAADHNIAVSSLMLHIGAMALWVGGLIALVARRGGENPETAANRFSALALCCFVAVGVSGLVNAWVRLGSVAAFLDSRYGLLVLAKVAALAVLGWFGYRHRGRTLAAMRSGQGSRPFLRLATGEVAVMAGTLALAVALSRTPPPRAEQVHGLHELLGYVLPPLTTGRLFTVLRPDPILVLAVLGVAAAYLLGVRRLGGQGVAWPIARTAAAFAGLVVILYAASGGLAAYGPAVFSVHAVQYALLGTVGPALFAVGAPLAPLRVAAPLAGAALTGKVAARAAHPLVATALYAVPYLVLYVTGVFEATQSSLAVRLTSQLVVVLTGAWFFFVAFAVDPPPAGNTPEVRTMMIVGALATQAWIALVLLIGPIQGQDWYAALALPWAPDRFADQGTGVLTGPVVAAAAIVILFGLLSLRRRERSPEPEKAAIGV